MAAYRSDTPSQYTSTYIYKLTSNADGTNRLCTAATGAEQETGEQMCMFYNGL